MKENSKYLIDVLRLGKSFGKKTNGFNRCDKKLENIRHKTLFRVSRELAAPAALSSTRYCSITFSKIQHRANRGRRATANYFNP